MARKNWVVVGGVARENWVVSGGVATGSKGELSGWLVHVGVLRRTGGVEKPRVPGLFHSCPSLSQRPH